MAIKCLKCGYSELRCAGSIRQTLSFEDFSTKKRKIIFILFITFFNDHLLGKIEGKWRRGPQRMRCFDSATDSVDVNLSKLQEIAEDRGT